MALHLFYMPPCSLCLFRVDKKDTFPLLQLPQPCLVAVLQSCDIRSLVSAARAHSKLHHAAVLAASSIKAVVSQQQVDGMLQYLTKIAQHVNSIELQGNARAKWSRQPYGAPSTPVILRELPQNDLQRLESLDLLNFHLQLQPCSDLQGVLGAGQTLKRLHLHDCTLLEGEEGLAEALSALPSLQHLSVSGCTTEDGELFAFPSVALQALQQLTYLQLSFSGKQCAHPDSMYHWQCLTSLQELHMHFRDAYVVEAGMLLGSEQLTRLELWGQGVCPKLEPGFLAGSTRLQHLALVSCSIHGEYLRHARHSMLRNLDFSL
jgi:hypothetical protein